jgi:hypothetical protein
MARARPTAGGVWDARVEVTIKSLGEPPMAQCRPPVTGSWTLIEVYQLDRVTDVDMDMDMDIPACVSSGPIQGNFLDGPSGLKLSNDAHSDMSIM